MSERRIGIAASASTANEVLQNIQAAEESGISAAWLTTGGTGLDGLTVFAAAAAQTEKIMLGTSITPTFPRHPIVVAQQVQVLDQLAPGRFRLGIGSSHRPTMRAMFGIEMKAPLGHLREYIHILKQLLHQGSVDFDGRYYHAHGTIPAPVDVPIMASALQPGSFELCGAEADGAISWVCPSAYLRDVAMPALRTGADKAGREVPPLIAHVPVCVHENPDEVRVAVQQQLANYPRLPFYQRMFEAAGFPEAAEETWSDAMIAGTVLSGNEDQVKAGLQGLFDLGASEILVSPLHAGPDREASLARTMGLLAQVSLSLNP